MQQRLADLRTEFDMARELADDLAAEYKAVWQEADRCRDQFGSLRVSLHEVTCLDTDVDTRLVAQAVARADRRMVAAHQAELRARARLDWATNRCEALRATLKAAEYLAEQEVAQR